MQKNLLYLFIVSLLSGTSFSQNLILKPSIGIGPLPSDADSICPIPTYTGSFYTSGLQAGDTVADFTLYNLNGDSLNIKTELLKGKPVLLVAGSYTCPVFRGKELVINDVITTYGSGLSVFVIYGVEAHPDIDISPYFGFVNTTSSNMNAGILYRQPVTYGERKLIVSDMLSTMNIQAPVYIDGPCNNWWQYFGPAPNNSYLIDTNGIVFTKHGWFDKYPDDIFCDIDSLLGITGNCSGTSNNGQFTFTMTGSNMVTGAPGTTIYVKGEIVNNTNKNVLIEVQRLQMNLPAGWQSSMCTDVCLSTATDSTSVLLAPNDSQSFTIYFYTDATIDSGMVRIGFRNTADQANMYSQYFYGITDSAFAGVNENVFSEKVTSSIFPNPFSTSAILQINDRDKFKTCELKIHDLCGREISILKIPGSATLLDRGNLSPGTYFYSLNGDGIALDFGKFVVM